MIERRRRSREQVILADQIRHCDSRLAEIELTCQRLNDGNYQKSELLDEARALNGTRNASAHRLRVLNNTDDDLERERREQDQARVEQMRQARAEAYRRQCEAQAEQCERVGDHRQAKLHRLEALRAHAVAEWEIR